jgi:hypothetical protein
MEQGHFCFLLSPFLLFFEGKRSQPGFQGRLATIGVHSRLVGFRRDGGIQTSGLRFQVSGFPRPPPLVTRHSSVFGRRLAGDDGDDGEGLRPEEAGG